MECTTTQVIRGNSLLHLRLDLQQFPDLLDKEGREQELALSSLQTGFSPQKRKSYFQELVKSQKNRGAKTMDPEFEELKGFMELGFEFREDQFDPRIMDIVPGLKHLIVAKKIKVKAREELQQDSVIMLPHPILMKGEDMKELLKLWARSVASTLR